MTREEAIKELTREHESVRRLAIDSEISALKPLLKSLEMAIEALSAEEADGCLGCEYEGLSEFDEPCTDCKNNYLNKWTTKKTEPSEEWYRNTLQGIPTVYLLEALGVGTYEELMAEAEPSGDLISRADAIEALCHNCAYYTDAQCKTDSGYWCESGAMIREDIPSADRPMGEWVHHEIEDTCRWIECSLCHKECPNIDLNYCPFCGALMADKGVE